MNDIQKAIDEIIASANELASEKWMAENLKSLLEQVAEKAFVEGHSKEYHNVFDGFEDWWKEQNLTFNED